MIDEKEQMFYINYEGSVRELALGLYPFIPVWFATDRALPSIKNMEVGKL